MKESLKLKLLHIFFPNKCPSCGKIIKYDEIFCDKCISDIEPVSGERCKVCFNLKQYCNCASYPKFYIRSASPFVYSKSIKAAVLSLKRIKNKRLAKFFAENMARTVNKKFKNTEFDAIIAVPLHKSKKLARGFNQSELLAKELSAILGVPYLDNVLVRIAKGKAQHTLKYKQRRENIKGLYAAGGIPIECQRVLLVDDVMTSGATMNECAKTLRLEGVSRIYCVAAAKTERI